HWLGGGLTRSAGIRVPTGAAKNAAAAWVSVRWVAGSPPAGGAAAAAAAGCWACAGAVGARPAATAVLAPNKKLRRAIGLLSSGVFFSGIAAPPVFPAPA